MTATKSPPLVAPALAVSGRGTHHRRELAIALAILVLALVVRVIRHSTNYELFVDEVTYSNIGLAIASGRGVALYGQPFFLHPPAFLYVLAAAIDVFGRPSSVIDLVMNLRVVNGVIGTIEVGLMMCLVYRIVGRWWALAAGLLMALDPFLLLYDGRVMLETLAMTASTAGMLAFVALGKRLPAVTGLRLHAVAGPDSHTVKDSGPASPREGRLSCFGLAVASGLGFGVALLTKETYVFAGAVPIAIVLITGWYMPRRWSAVVLVTAVGCYVGYVATLLLNHNIRAWWDQQDYGLLRATGERQISGFNQSGHVGFTTRVLATAPNYLGTYAIMGLGGLAVLWAAWRWWRSDWRGSGLRSIDVMTIWAACTGCFVAFSVLRGAFEQQIFYPFLVSSIPVTTLAVRSWTSRSLRTPGAEIAGTR